MITATQTGNGWYVEGNRYKVRVTKSGITEMYLKLTGNPTVNVLYGGGMVFNEAYGATAGTVTLGNADSSISLVEANAVRVVLSASGFYEPGSGGTKYGTGSARLVFYPDRFAVESVSQFTASLGSGMCVRPVTASYQYNRCREDYCYDTDKQGSFTWFVFSGSWAPVVSGIGGPLTFMTIHSVGAAPGGYVTAVVLNGQGYSTFDLWDALSSSTYMAWRAQKSNAVTGQRYRAVSIFNFAVCANVQNPNENSAVAARDDLARPDPLDGSANAGVVLTGTKVTNVTGDEDHDGYLERDTAYVLQPSGAVGYLDVRFDDRRGTSTAAAFARPVIRLNGWGPNTKPEVFRYSGAAWQLLAEGTDYATTTEADEPSVGPQTRVVQILSDLSGQGTSGARLKFVQVYDEPPAQGDWTLKIAGQEIDMESARVSLRRLASSWRLGRVLEIAQAAAHTAATWHEGQQVELICQSRRVFLGDIAERRLVGAPGAEEALYLCRDLRARAQKVTVTDAITLAPRVVFNAPTGDSERIDQQSDLTVGAIIAWLFERFEDELVDAGAAEEGTLPYEYDDLAGLDAVPPKTVLANLDFDAALGRVLSYEPEVFVSFDPTTLKYRFLRLGDLAAADVTYNSDDRPLSSLVTPTLDGRSTAYLIVGQGEKITRTAYLVEGELEEYWGGRATTLQNVSAGTGVVIPVDNTIFFKAGDQMQVGSGSSGETTTILSIVPGTSITANLSKNHAAGTIVTNKAYLEDHWTIDRAFEPADSDSGTATGGQVGYLTDSSKMWATDRWVGGEVTLVKPGIIQKRTVIDSNGTMLYVSPNWTVAPSSGDSYEVKIGVSRYRYVFSRYRVADEDKRRIAETVPDPAALAPLPGLALVSYRPRVWRKTPAGFWVITPVVFDYPNGVFTAAMTIATGNVKKEGQADAPPDMRLDYAYVGDPCQARYPAQSFTGTAYTQGGLERERVRYEEDFATPASTAQYQALAEKLLWPLKDIAYRGVLSLAVVEPAWLALDYRINIKAKNDAGGSVPTGLESIQALAAGSEIDFGLGRTQIMLADAEALTSQADWFRALADTMLVFEQSAGSGSGGDGGPTGGDVYVTINDISELFVSTSSTLGGGLVTSVTAGGDNGIIEVSPEVGDVVVSHADYTSGNKTPCNYAPRWQ